MYFTTCIDIVLLTPRSERVKSSNHGGGMTVWGGCEEVCVDGCFDIHVNFFSYVSKGTLAENWEKGLRQFSQLIYNKKFLLVFIRTLESQNTFQMKDRLVVLSYITVLK